MTVSTFDLGDPVTFDWVDVLTRRTRQGFVKEDPLMRKRWIKEWDKNRFLKPGKVGTGIVVGARTLADGYNDGGMSWDDPIIFQPLTYRSVLLVAFDLRRRPVYLSPDDVRSTP